MVQTFRHAHVSTVSVTRLVSCCSADFFKGFKAGMGEFLGGYGSSEFDEKHQRLLGIDLEGTPASNYTVCALLQVRVSCKLISCIVVFFIGN